MSADDDSIRGLVADAGWFPDCTATPIGGTGNNAVFRIDADGRRYVLKRYFQHPGDPRDRFATERAFATFLWETGVRWTPEPLRWDAGRRLGLFEHIAGARPERATPERIAAALRFFTEANARRATDAARALPLASEACFSIGEHFDRVAQRVERLRQIPADTDIATRAVAFVTEELRPAWGMILARSRSGGGDGSDGAADSRLPGAGGGGQMDVRNSPPTPGSLESAAPEDRPLPSSERCLSPSDFGFHNCIVTPEGAVRFLDFEYAGWDDPAKLVCDFFCQPAVPVAIEHLDAFVRGLGDFDSPALRDRIATLLPVYRIKWCCIMLNDFLPADHRRRAFSNPGHDPLARQREQLEKARRALSHLSE